PLPSRPDRELPAGGRFCGHSRGAASVHGRFGQNRSGKEALKAFLPKNSYLLSMQTWVIMYQVREGKGARADEWSGLENRRGFAPSVRSNPTPSAIFWCCC